MRFSLRLAAALVLAVVAAGVLRPLPAEETSALSPELRKACTDCLGLLGKHCVESVDRGLVPDRSFLDEKSLAEFERKCEAVAAAAGKREDIARAAKLLRDAARYQCRHPHGKNKEREVPDNQDLAGLLKGADGKISEARVTGALAVAGLRLAQFLGPVPLSEEEIMREREAASAGGTVGGLHPFGSPRNPADEITLSVATDGSFSVDGKPVDEKDLADVLKQRKAKSKEGGGDLRCNIMGSKASSLQQIQTALDACQKAGIDNLAFRSKG